jgi:hypothetical protein
MNTLQNVFNKIATKTELEKHEVELASIQDLQKLNQNAYKNLAEFKKHEQDIKAIAKLLISSAEKFNDNTRDINLMAKDLSKQFKELGLNFLDNADVKAATQILNMDFEVGQYLGYVRQIVK